MTVKQMHAISGNTAVVAGSEGAVWKETISSAHSTFNQDSLVWAFEKTTSTDAMASSFVVPLDFVSAPVLVLVWQANATTGTIRWGYGYRSTATGGNPDATAGYEEEATQDVTVTATANELIETRFSLTAANISAGDAFVYEIQRHSGALQDNLAARARLWHALFEYDDV